MWNLVALTWLTAASATPTPSDDPGAGHRIARAAAEILETRPALRVEACNGLVEQVLERAGYPTRGSVHALWAALTAAGRTQAGGDPHPGDLVFWHKTYDGNRNGIVDDSYTHVGVVISVDAAGTALIVHRAASGIGALRQNLRHPTTYRRDGVVLNSFIASPRYNVGGPRLTGELFAGFASFR